MKGLNVVLAALTLLVLPQIATAGSNAGFTAELSWQPDSLVTVRPAMPTGEESVFLLLDGASDLQRLGFSMQYAHSDEGSGCFELVSVPSGMCSPVSAVVSPDSLFDHTVFTWTVDSAAALDTVACIELRFDFGQCSALPGVLVLDYVKAEDSLGGLDYAIEGNSITVLGGIADEPSAAVAGVTNLDDHPDNTMSADLFGAHLDNIKQVWMYSDSDPVPLLCHVSSVMADSAGITFAPGTRTGFWNLVVSSVSGATDTLFGAVELGGFSGGGDVDITDSFNTLENFNERGLREGTSYRRVTEFESVSNFNGNLSYRRPLYGVDLGDGLRLDVTLNYNGGMGHRLIRIRDDLNYKVDHTAIAVPGWSLGLMGMMIMPFNFTNELYDDYPPTQLDYDVFRTEGFNLCDRGYDALGFRAIQTRNVLLGRDDGSLLEFAWTGGAPLPGFLAMFPVGPVQDWRAWSEATGFPGSHNYNREIVVKSPDGITFVYHEVDIRSCVQPPGSEASWGGYDAGVGSPRALRLGAIVGRNGRTMLLTYSYQVVGAECVGTVPCCPGDGDPETDDELPDWQAYYLAIDKVTISVDGKDLLEIEHSEQGDELVTLRPAPLPGGGSLVPELGTVALRRWDDGSRFGLEYVGEIIDQEGQSTTFDYEDDTRGVVFPTFCGGQRYEYKAHRVREITYPTGGRTVYQYQPRSGSTSAQCVTHLSDEPEFLNLTGRSAESNNIVTRVERFLDETSSSKVLDMEYVYSFDHKADNRINNAGHRYRTTVISTNSPSDDLTTPDFVQRSYVYRKSPYISPPLVEVVGGSGVDERASWETLLIEEEGPYAVGHQDNEVKAYTYDTVWDAPNDGYHHQLLQTFVSRPAEEGGTASYLKVKQEYDIYGNVDVSYDALGHRVETGYWLSAVDWLEGFSNPASASEAISSLYSVRTFKSKTGYPSGSSVPSSFQDQDVNFTHGGRLEREGVATAYDAASQTFTVASDVLSYDYTTGGPFPAPWVVTKRTDVLSREVRYSWDKPMTSLGGGILGSYVQPDWIDYGSGISRRETYESNGKNEIELARDMNGGEFFFDYDALGRVKTVQRSGESSPKSQYAYFPNLTNLTQRQGPLGDGKTLVTEYEFDGIDRLVERRRYRDGLPITSTTEYNMLDQVWQETDEESRQTRYERDAFGRVVRVRYHDGTEEQRDHGQQRSLSYDGLSYPWPADVSGTQYFMVEEVIDAENHRTIRLRDPLDRLRAVAYVDEGERKVATYYRYDDRGNLTAIRHPNGTETTYRYDFASRLTGVNLPDMGGQHTSLLSVQHDELVGTAQTSSFTPGLKAVQYEVDIDRADEQCAMPHFVVRDDSGFELLRIERPGSFAGALRVASGTLHEVESLSPCSGNVVTATVRYQTQQSLGGTWDIEYVYDSTGNVRFIQDATDHITGTDWVYVKYDELGRVAEEGLLTGVAESSLLPNDPTYPQGTGATPVIVYEYDQGVGTNVVGRLARVERFVPGEALERFAKDLWYDDTRRVEQERVTCDDGTGQVNVQKSVSFDYTWQDQVAEIDYPAPLPSVEYKYDDLGLLRDVLHDAGVIATHSYYDSGELDVLAYSNGATADFDYNDRLLVDRQQIRDGVGTAIIDESLTYYLNATLRQRISAGQEVTTFEYDPLDRLERIVFPDQTETAYEYDDIGNRLTEYGPHSGSAQDRVVHTYATGTSRIDKTDQPGEASDEFAFDADGQLVVWNRHVGGRNLSSMLFAYSHDGHVTEQRLYSDGGAEFRHTYLDEDGEPSSVVKDRQYRLAGTEWRGQVRDAGRLLVEFDETGVETESHVFSGEHVIARYADGALEFEHFDYGGSTRAVTNDSGAAVRSFEYHPFGEVRRRKGIGESRFGFHGGETSLGEVARLGARHYAATLGRFGAVDPALLRVPPEKMLNDPLGSNPYAYARNNPLTLKDDTGELWDTVTDVISIGVSVVNFAKNPNLENGVTLGLDIVAAAAPGIPSPTSIKLVAKAADAIQGARSADKAADAGRAAAGATDTAARQVTDGVCFPAGTSVVTERGAIPIEQVAVGDLVLSMADEFGELVWAPVTSVSERNTSELVTVLLEGGGGFTATPRHPVWILGAGWTHAGDLQAGDVLVSSGHERIAVARTGTLVRWSPVYNFEVAGTHSYFAGAEEIWVHNGACAPGGGGTPGGGSASVAGDGPRFNDEQAALIDMAKKDKKLGISEGDAEAYKELGEEVGVAVRGVEQHPGRTFNKPHIHVGPVDHIPVSPD